MIFPVYYILPYPPSDNRRFIGHGKVLSKSCKNFIDAVTELYWENCNRIETIKEPVRATILLYPANHRRDAANCLKVLFDALEKNKIIENDMLIKDVEVLTCETDPSDIVIVGFEPRNKTLIDTMPKRIKSLLKHYREQMFYSSSTAKAIDAGRKAMT